MRSSPAGSDATTAASARASARATSELLEGATVTPWLRGLYVFAPIVLLALFRDLWAPDEPRYAEVAREAYAHDFLVMHLNGEVYPDKPPLVYWLAGLCGQLAGWHEFALRLPSLVATLVTAFVAARFARARFGALEAAWTPLFVLGTVMVLEIGGRLQLDPVLTACTFTSAVLASDERGDRKQRTWRILLAGLLAGLGALAKGPVAWLHVGVGVLALRRARDARAETASARPGWGIWIGFVALALAPVLTWALAAVARQPELFRALFFGQHVGRVVDGTQHRGPPWEHLLHLPLYFLPFTPLLVLALARAWRGLRGRLAQPDPVFAALALWFAVVFVVFSAMPPKRDLYLLPIYPVAALLCARVVAEAQRAGRVIRGAWLPVAALWCLLGVAGIAAVVLLGDAAGQSGLLAGRGDELANEVRQAAELVAPVRGWIAAAFAVLAAGGVAACLRAVARRGRIPDALAGSLALALALLATFVAPVVNEVKSARGLGTWLAARPEKPVSIPCLGVQPEGYRFYGGVPAVKEDFGAALARDGAQFLAIATEREFRKLPAELRAKVRILEARSVGSRDVVVLGAAP